MLNNFKLLKNQQLTKQFSVFYRNDYFNDILKQKTNLQMVFAQIMFIKKY